jgi:hypothetical protein
MKFRRKLVGLLGAGALVWGSPHPRTPSRSAGRTSPTNSRTLHRSVASSRRRTWLASAVAAVCSPATRTRSSS